ncbi:biotin synthase BioB [Treponema sp.]|uniref:biotin synthase BioB n=1 Tax=Treponema sp. TaxID=166 RepID=UPI003F0D373B
MNTFTEELENAVIHQSHQVTREEALELYKEEQPSKLFEAADRIRKNFCPNTTSICSIINAKSGKCGEDCKYCAQSAHWKSMHSFSEVIEPEKSVELCRRAVDNSIRRISLVTSGRGLSGKEFEAALENFRAIKNCLHDKIKLCASLGILSPEQMQELKKTGVERYHHNLETSQNYFGKICTTHSYTERVQTILNAKKAGLEICSGGIIGMGETREDRIDMALELRNLDVQSVPINVLMPVKGTPFESMEKIPREEILKTIAVFRFIMPAQTIRCAAGRKSLGDNGRDAFLSGANALISGDFLTTSGSTNEEDISMLKQLGYGVL